MKRKLLLVSLTVLAVSLTCSFAWAKDLVPNQIADIQQLDRLPASHSPGELLSENPVADNNVQPGKTLWKESTGLSTDMAGEDPIQLTNTEAVIRPAGSQPILDRKAHVERLSNGNGLRGKISSTSSTSTDRDIDGTLIGWSGTAWGWHQHNYPDSENATTYSGNYYVMTNNGVNSPFKILGFGFYNNDATTNWDAGVIINAGSFPTSAEYATLQVTGYNGADQGWSYVDLTPYNVYGNSLAPVVFTSLHWENGCSYSGAGSGCAVVYDSAEPHLAVNYVTFDSGGTTYYYPTADFVDYLDFEVMPDTCAQADEWPLSIPGTVTAHDTSYGNDDYDPNTCGISKNGPDLVYALKPGATVTVNITCSTVIGGPDIVLLLSDSCDPLNCVAQADAGGAGAAETISGVTLTGGTDYYIIVDTPGTGGSITLTVTPTGSAPGNDTCAGATAITVPYSGSGDTYTANDDYSATCGGLYGSTGGDVVYSYTPTSNEYVAITLTPSDFDAVLYVVTDCSDTSSCVASADNNSENTAEQLNCVGMTAGTTYYIIVDGYDSDDHGAFDLVVNPTSPPANDTCAAAETVASIPASVSGDTSCASDDYDGSCTGATMDGGDVVYTYTTGSSDEYVLLTLTPDNYDAGIYVVTDCSDPTMATCVDWADYYGSGGTEYLCVHLSASTTYYFIVDGYTASDVGTFTLDFDTASAPTNDTCATAEAITSLPVAYTGATTCGSNDYDPTASGCTGYDETGPDVVFSYTPGTDMNVSALVDSYYGDVDFALYIIDSDCSDPVANCIAGADDGGVGDFEQLTCIALTAGHTYYFVIDSMSPAYFGVYYFRLWEDTTITNEDCSTATVVSSLPFNFSGTTGCATDDYNPAAGTCAPGGGNGPDVVFSYTPASDETIVATVDPFYFRTTFYVIESDCSDFGNCIEGGTSDEDGYKVTTGCFDVTAGTTYYFVVDGWRSTDLGAYSIEIRNASVPTNEDCSTAQAITLPADIMGDTICATSDFGFDLGGGTYTGVGAPDVVYDLPTYTSDTNINITFLPDDFTGDLILIEDCAGSPTYNLLGYQVPAGYIVRESCYPLTAGVDYKILIDGDTSQDYGTFELIVEEASAVTNDDCASATVISALPYSDSGYTDCGADDYDPTASGCTGYDETGFDVVYSFTPSSNMDIDVTLNTTYHDGSVYIVTDCSDVVNTCIAGADDNYAVGDETLSQVSLTAGTTYYIVVDAWNQYQAGPYTLTVSEYTPPVLPATGPVGLGLLIAALSGLLGFNSLRRRKK